MIRIVSESSEVWAEELSSAYGWPIVTVQNTGENFFYLKKINNQLCIDFKDLKNIGFDFSKKYYKLEGSIFAKAIGKGSKTILDATAGLLKDTYKMLLLGHSVTSVENNPLIYELSKSAVSNAGPKIFDKLNLLYGNSLDIKEGSYDVVYIDPMFAHVSKSALPKKDMQLFRKINEHMPSEKFDETEFIEWAKELGAERIVVKRPLKQAKGSRVAHSFLGKSVRYDLYMNA